jgi:hypothetical protein
VLEKKGYSMDFSKGKDLMWPSNSSLSSAMKIETQGSGLYKIIVQVVQKLSHEMINPYELWKKRLG